MASRVCQCPHQAARFTFPQRFSPTGAVTTGAELVRSRSTPHRADSGPGYLGSVHGPAL